MLSLATSHIAHYCNQLNHDALPISMPRFKSIIFIKIALKLSYFCKKMQSFRALVAPPQTPKTSPLRISGYAPVSAGFHLKSRKKVFDFWEDLFFGLNLFT